MEHESSGSNDGQQSKGSDQRTAADDIDKDDPHKVEKLANIGKDADLAEVAEKE